MNIVWDFSIQKQLNYGFISLNIAERLTVIERSRILRINCKSESWTEKESHTTLKKILKKRVTTIINNKQTLNYTNNTVFENIYFKSLKIPRESVCNLGITMITEFKVFIWGGISLDLQCRFIFTLMRTEVHHKTNSNAVPHSCPKNVICFLYLLHI